MVAHAPPTFTHLSPPVLEAFTSPQAYAFPGGTVMKHFVKNLFPQSGQKDITAREGRQPLAHCRAT